MAKKPKENKYINVISTKMDGCRAESRGPGSLPSIQQPLPLLPQQLYVPQLPPLDQPNWPPDLLSAY